MKAKTKTSDSEQQIQTEAEEEQKPDRQTVVWGSGQTQKDNEEKPAHGLLSWLQFFVSSAALHFQVAAVKWSK